MKTAQTSESSLPAALSGWSSSDCFLCMEHKQAHILRIGLESSGNPGLLYALDAVQVQGARGTSRWVKTGAQGMGKFLNFSYRLPKQGRFTKSV